MCVCGSERVANTRIINYYLVCSVGDECQAKFLSTARGFLPGIIHTRHLKHHCDGDEDDTVVCVGAKMETTITPARVLRTVC